MERGGRGRMLGAASQATFTYFPASEVAWALPPVAAQHLKLLNIPPGDSCKLHSNVAKLKSSLEIGMACRRGIVFQLLHQEHME